MGIFSRLRDIVNSNIHSMLEAAEDPEKLVKLMIQEMEDTLVEIKASCAGTMASRKKLERALDETRGRAAEWERRAELAVKKGREDLAREALREKRVYLARVESLESEVNQCADLVAQYQSDIEQIEKKLATARDKQRVLIQRHKHAGERKKVRGQVRRVETTDAFARFDAFENRIERMEAEADLADFGRKPSLEEEFIALDQDDDIEEELEALKTRTAPGESGGM